MSYNYEHPDNDPPSSSVLKSTFPSFPSISPPNYLVTLNSQLEYQRKLKVNPFVSYGNWNNSVYVPNPKHLTKKYHIDNLGYTHKEGKDNRDEVNNNGNNSWNISTDYSDRVVQSDKIYSPTIKSPTKNKYSLKSYTNLIEREYLYNESLRSIKENKLSQDILNSESFGRFDKQSCKDLSSDYHNKRVDTLKSVYNDNTLKEYLNYITPDIISPPISPEFKNMKQNVIKNSNNMNNRNLITKVYKHIGNWERYPNSTEFAWSCCLSEDKNSRGCISTNYNKDKWNYTSPNDRM